MKQDIWEITIKSNDQDEMSKALFGKLESDEGKFIATIINTYTKKIFSCTYGNTEDEALKNAQSIIKNYEENVYYTNEILERNREIASKTGTQIDFAKANRAAKVYWEDNSEILVKFYRD